MDKAIANTIIENIELTISDIYPDAISRPMYGGIIFEKEAGNSRTRVLGYFVYKQHISLEFTHGAKFEDPSNVLEGKGIFRRHLKLYTPDDIKRLHASFFIRQAFEQD